MQKKNVCIQLVDRSYITPLGIVEDVLIKISNISYIDFYILQMNGQPTRPSPTILPRIYFLKTATTIINVDQGSHSVELW